VVAFVDTP
jgi:hypothetical protein